MKKILVIIILIFGFTLFAKNGGRVGDTAPEFTLGSLEGKEYRLSDYKGKKALLIVFFATWCPSCRAEIPKLIKIKEEFAGRGLELISINPDINDSEKRSKKYGKKFNVTYPILYDKGQKVSKKYGVMGVPTAIIVDINGVVQYHSAVAPENIGDHITRLLTKK